VRCASASTYIVAVGTCVCSDSSSFIVTLHPCDCSSCIITLHPCRLLRIMSHTSQALPLHSLIPFLFSSQKELMLHPSDGGDVLHPSPSPSPSPPPPPLPPPPPICSQAASNNTATLFRFIQVQRRVLVCLRSLLHHGITHSHRLLLHLRRVTALVFSANAARGSNIVPVSRRLPLHASPRTARHRCPCRRKVCFSV
jgi:hypothetical protein